jgi:glycosyltransferase involved in cell wall biosynthesis
MTYEPLVSIIVNCYNGEKYLDRCLRSIVSQTYTNWEIVFWDNKSTDKSSSIFKRYTDKRFKYFLGEKNTTLYQARNFAISVARGELISFLDTDDWWIDTKLKKQVKFFKDKNVNFVYSNFFVYYENKKYKKLFYKKKLPSGFVTNNLLYNYTVGILTVIIRRSIFSKFKCRFNIKYNIIGDFDLVLKLSRLFKFKCIQEPLAYYSQHNQNYSYLNYDLLIKEFKDWVFNNKFEFGNNFSSGFSSLNQKIRYMEIISGIIKKNFFLAFKDILKFPFSFKKIKLIIILVLPRFILKKYFYINK